MKLSKNFTYEELIASTTASNKGIDNTPNEDQVAQLKLLCEKVLQPIRDKYNHPIIITSGFRCKALNKAVGGSNTSQHMMGQAADIKCTATTKAYLFNLILSMIKSGEIKVGQLIWEYGTKKEPNWIHISLPYSKVNNILYLYNK